MIIDWQIPLAVFVGSLLSTPFIRHYAMKRRLVDVPNVRSSHETPTPRGGGLAIVVSCMVAMILLIYFQHMSFQFGAAFVGAGLIVAAAGFWDDHGHVPPRWRIVVHFVAALWAWSLLNGTAVFPHLSPVGWFFNAFLVVSIVWVLNLYNFMDGIDAIASAETIFIAVGAALLFHLSGAGDLALFAALLAASTAGFLIWNLPPARIFLGDVGSGFLGIIIGMLALAGIMTGAVNIWVWLILLGVFLVDATLTVARRILRGARFYEAHRSHAYQHLALQWKSHGKVTLVVTAINVLWLLPLALAAWRWQDYGPLLFAVAFAPLIWLAFYFKAGVEKYEFTNIEVDHGC